MKSRIILIFILLANSNCMFGQVTTDTLSTRYIYAPNNIDDSLSAEESWEIHRAAYIKQLQANGLTKAEVKKSMVTYEEDKKVFIAQVKQEYRLAAIQREKSAEQRALAEVERLKADDQRRLADIQRIKAEEMRKLAEIEEEKVSVQRGMDAVQREKADELRKLAEVERAKAQEQRKLAEIQRLKAEEERKKSQAWRKNSENILIKNISFANFSDDSNPITFEVTSTTKLHIGIRAHINSGSALIEIYNPSGVKEAELSMDHKSTSNSSVQSDVSKYTSGSLDKTISYAEAGEWQIKISSQKAMGTVAMSVFRQVKPTIDE